MPNLYPEVNLPSIVTPTSESEIKLRPAPKFDLSSGDFILDSAGRMIIADPQEAFQTWCIKACMTERGERLAYSDNYGIEFEAAMQMSSAEAAKSAIIRTLTETLMAHPATEYVKNFHFTGDGDELNITFDVKAKPFTKTFTITVTY